MKVSALEAFVVYRQADRASMSEKGSRPHFRSRFKERASAFSSLRPKPDRR